MKKKQTWTARLDIDNWNWLKKIADQTGVSGSDIIDELIAREAQDASGRFKAELARRRTAAELDKIRQKLKDYESKEKVLERKLESDRIET